MIYKRVLPQQHQENVEQFYNTQTVPSDGIYGKLSTIYTTLNEKYTLNNMPRDLEVDYFKNSKRYHPKSRYANNQMVRQQEFDNFPAAKIPTGNTPDKFDVITEGPDQNNLSNLLKDLNTNGVNVLIPVGNPMNGEKYYDYIVDSEEISLQDFFAKASSLTEIPAALLDTAKDTQFKFYRYTSKEFGEFYIMYVPNWDDHGMPRFNKADKTVLGHFFEYVNPACAHCSAGVGRSIALMMIKMFYMNVFKSRDTVIEDDIKNYFNQALNEIKEKKPIAGELYQLLTVPGLAEDIYELVGHQLKYGKTTTAVQEQTVSFPKKPPATEKSPNYNPEQWPKPTTKTEEDATMPLLQNRHQESEQRKNSVCCNLI